MQSIPHQPRSSKTLTQINGLNFKQKNHHSQDIQTLLKNLFNSDYYQQHRHTSIPSFITESK